LQAELERFKEKIRERPETVKVLHSKGYTGGGYSGAGFTILFLLLASIAAWRIRRHRAS
jgi:rhombotail lipoprotein